MKAKRPRQRWSTKKTTELLRPGIMAPVASSAGKSMTKICHWPLVQWPFFLMEIVFATNNLHKLEEIRALVNHQLQIVGLQEMGISEEIPETEDTLEGNAMQKARYIYNKLKIPCFADDTGLEVEALNNQPGVYSARYAGKECDPQKNMDKLLQELAGKENRKARFRTVIAFIHQDKEYVFEGSVEGAISSERKGNKGFGYDPVFLPQDYPETFAEMSLEAKHTISHRSRAMKKFVSFINDELFRK